MTKIDRPNRDALSNALDIYRDAMRPFIIRCLKRVPGKRVEDAISESLYEKRELFLQNLDRSGNVEDAIDINDFPSLIIRKWQPVFSQVFKGDKTVGNLLWVIVDVRNKVAHPGQQDLDAEYTRIRLYDIADLLGRINAPEAKRAVEDIRDQLLVPTQSEYDDSGERLEGPGRNNKNDNKNDNVTSFARRVRYLAVNGLSDEIKPTKNSIKAGVLRYKNRCYRYYHLWYKGSPWGNWTLFYEVEMRFDDPSEGMASCSNAHVAIRYYKEHGKIGGLSVDESESLQSLVDNLDIHRDQKIDEDQRRKRNRWRRVEVNFGSNTLNDEFANALADTLRRFIEFATPKIMDFWTSATKKMLDGV